MALSPPLTLSHADKLDALRQLDQFRQSHSLDDKRFCLVCGKIITGRQIEVVGVTRGTRPLQLSCPTERCDSIPMDWVLPTDEILAVLESTSSEESTVAPSRAADSGLEYGLAARLRKFAVHFTSELSNV
jgi:hypothetical protein